MSNFITKTAIPAVYMEPYGEKVECTIIAVNGAPASVTAVSHSDGSLISGRADLFHVLPYVYDSMRRHAENGMKKYTTPYDSELKEEFAI